LGGLSAEVVRLRDDEGLGFQEIAARLGLPNRDAAARQYTAGHSKRGKPDFSDVLHSKTFKTKRPVLAASRGGKWRRTVIYSDSHFRHANASWGHDPKALAVVLSVIRDVEPHTIIHGGDLLDCYTLSQKFDPDPADLFTIQDEVDAAAAHLDEVAQIAPKALRIWLEGNHENRLTRLVCGLPGAHRELARLKVFQRALTWEAIMGIADIGWSFIPLKGQSRADILPKLISKHGTTVSKWSGHTAKNEWMKYGKSGTSGHTHRLGSFYHNDHNGAHIWNETGCTCKITNVPYMDDPDWQQGLLVITHTEDGERFSVEDIYIQNGVAIYREREYAA
jgi:hypothetical protein